MANATTILTLTLTLIRGLILDNVFQILLVCPVSSCKAERSFSGRLKTWLRNSMSQSRLNAVAVSHVHQDIGLLDGISGIAYEFASRSQTRRALLMFGRGQW